MWYIYSELAIARESAITTNIWERLKGRQGMESFHVENGEAFRCTTSGHCCNGEAEGGLPRRGQSMSLNRTAYLASSKLKTGGWVRCAKPREAGY